MEARLTDDELADFLRAHLDASVEAELFSRHHLSHVCGVRLDSGDDVVVKARPWHPRLRGTTAVHVAAHHRGLPCPELLVPLERVGPDGRAVSVERYEPAGDLLPRGRDQLKRSAHALAQTVTALAGVELEPAVRANLTAVPWLDWGGDRLWPTPDDVDADLNAIGPGDWIDSIAQVARVALLEHDEASVLGHGDFESSNVLYDADGDLAALHDWDSIVHLPEPCVAGAASLVFPANNEPVCSSVEEADHYLARYQQLRGQAWSPAQLRAAWAANTWQLAFNAKKEVAGGSEPQLGSVLRASLDLRLARLAA